MMFESTSFETDTKQEKITIHTALGAVRKILREERGREEGGIYIFFLFCQSEGSVNFLGRASEGLLTFFSS